MGEAGIGARPDEPPETVAALPAYAARRWGDRTAWEFPHLDARLTFAGIDRVSTAIAGDLRALGVTAGERVAVMLPNVPEFPLTWLALAKLGAVLVPVNTRYRKADAHHVLAHARVATVVTSRAYAPLLREVRTDLPGLRHVISVDGADGPDVRTLGEAGTAPVTEPIVAEQLLNVEYTSGTSGRPKGCMLPHRYWMTLATSLVREFPYVTAADVLFTAQPFSYIDPQWNAVVSLLAGARLVVADGFHPSTFWKTVRAYGVTCFYCLGVMPRLLLQAPPDPADRDHRVRAVLCSAIPAADHRALEDRWGVPWYEAFGMTETGADIGVTDADHDALVGTGCLGLPRGHREARVAGADGRPVPRGEVGELLLRGTGLMDGYLDDPDATAAVFRDGWLHTGDLARMDASGRIYHAGRTKEMIRRSGENIAATEVEEALQAHPAVRMCAVVGVPDDLRGEEVAAFVVLTGAEPGDAAARAEELTAYCADRLAAFKVPRYWAFRDALPMTPSERVAKPRLRDDDGPRHDVRPSGRRTR